MSPPGRQWQKAWRRKIRKAALRMLPKKMAHQWIRNSLNLAIPRANSTLRFEIASNASDMKAALTLVQQNFEREGYAQKAPQALRLTRYHLIPESLVIVAKDGSEVVASISLFPRTAFGIPLDSCFSLDSFLGQRGKIVEVSALAVSPAVRGQQGEVLYNLMKYMYHCNMEILGINTEVIGVNPKMIPLYEAILLFEKIPGAKTIEYQFANGAPVVPMYFNLDSAQQSFEKIYKNKPAHQNVMDFFLIAPPRQFTLPSPGQLDQVLPQRRPEELRRILSWNPELIQGLNEEQQNILEKLYQPWPDCARLIREATNARG